MMVVDMANLKADGVFLFTEDNFNAKFREVCVRRFVPLMNERFNYPNQPLTRLPEDVGDSLRLLVLCERLKAVLKEDVKQHLDKLVAKSANSATPVRPNEGAPFKILHASLELDTTIPPRGSLQERVVHRALDTLSSSLPESLDAIEELVRFACELGRHEMAARLFRSAAEKALAQAGIRVGGTSKTPSARAIDELAHDDQFESPREALERGETLQQVKAERAKLQALAESIERQRQELREERAKFDGLKGLRSENASPNFSTSSIIGAASSTAAAAEFGAIALAQGMVMDKVGTNSGERIVRLAGDVLEWRKGSGRFSKENAVARGDVVSVKVVDPGQGKTFLLSTKTGLLTLRTSSDACTDLLVAALDKWIAAQPKLKKAPAIPSPVNMISGPKQTAAAADTSGETSFVARRFPRISMSFKRGSFRQNASEVVTHQPGKNDYSFVSTDS